MQLKKCGMCGQLFPDIGVQFCMNCSEKMDEQFRVVRDYLYDHPNASIEEVYEGTQIPSKRIVHFLKEGRLRVVNATGLLKCEQCGELIDTGRFCAACTRKFEERMVKPLSAMQQHKNKPVGPTMHTERKNT